MLQENDQRALDLLNDGGNYYESSPSDAIDRWEEALTFKPALGLEALIRAKLVVAFLNLFVNLEEGTVLSEEQGLRCLHGERHLTLLHNLVKDANAQQGLQGLDAEDLEFCRRTVNTYGQLRHLLGQGQLILPGDESIERMIDYGFGVADSGDKPVAILLFEKALTLIDETKLGHKTHALRARVRLATLLSDVGRRAESCKYANWVLESGMAGDDLKLMMKSVIAIYDRRGEGPSDSDEDNHKRTPLFFKAAGSITAGKPPGDIWLEVLQKEFSLLSKDQQLCTLSQVCDLHMVRQEIEQLERRAIEGLKLARELKPGKSIAPFYTNFLEYLFRIAKGSEQHDTAAKFLMEAADVPYANAPYYLEQLSIFGFSSNNEPLGADYLIALVNHPGFDQRLSNDTEMAGSLFTLTFVSLADGTLDRNQYLKPVLKAWAMADPIWEKVNPTDPKLSEIRRKLKTFL